jgi:hypothetical protein
MGLPLWNVYRNGLLLGNRKPDPKKRPIHPKKQFPENTPHFANPKNKSNN